MTGNILVTKSELELNGVKEKWTHPFVYPYVYPEIETFIVEGGPCSTA
jgi:hypothetical protein